MIIGATLWWAPNACCLAPTMHSDAGYVGFIYQDVPRVTKRIKVNLDN